MFRISANLNIFNWQYADLAGHLKVASQEGIDSEYKEVTDLEAKKLRKCFAAFANTKGGLIFFGVQNRTRHPVGIPEDGDLKTKINRAISNTSLLPSIPPQNWDVVCAIPTPAKSFVYIVEICPSPFFSKPHIADNHIYVRENGESKPLSSGAELRGIFFGSGFNPHDIDLMPGAIQQFRNQHRLEYISAQYFTFLREYLEKLKRDQPGMGAKLFECYERICAIIDACHQEHINGLAATGGVSMRIPPNQESKLMELAERTALFVKDFKTLHHLG